MTIRTPHASTMAEVRRRLSRLSAEVQTLQRHPMTGTPCEVPVPRKVSFMQAKIVKIGRLRTGTPKNLPQCTGSAAAKSGAVARANTPKPQAACKTGEDNRGRLPERSGKYRKGPAHPPGVPGNTGKPGPLPRSPGKSRHTAAPGNSVGLLDIPDEGARALHLGGGVHLPESLHQRRDLFVVDDGMSEAFIDGQACVP